MRITIGVSVGSLPGLHAVAHSLRWLSGVAAFQGHSPPRVRKNEMAGTRSLGRRVRLRDGGDDLGERNSLGSQASAVLRNRTIYFDGVFIIFSFFLSPTLKLYFLARSSNDLFKEHPTVAAQ